MIKRVIVAGSRDYNNYREAKKYIDFCISRIKEIYTLVFLSGGCKGADFLGEKYAAENNFQIEKFPADWKKYGRSAGARRNREMANLCDYVICFWDGKSRGTKLIIDYAIKIGKSIKIKFV